MTEEKLASLVESFCDLVDRAERSWVKSGGMQVPYHDHFAMAGQLPSVAHDLRWWRDRFREEMKK